MAYFSQSEPKFALAICAENVTNKPLSDKRELQCGRIAAFAAFSCGSSNVNVLGMENSMKIGFIGLGNMAGAMLGGFLSAGIFEAGEIIGSAKTQETIDRAGREYGIHVTRDNKEAAQAEVVVLAVKPIYYEEIISEIKDVVTEEQIIVTIAPGKTLAWLAEQFGAKVKIVRTMPNTPALVSEGITAVCHNEWVTAEEISYVISLFQAFGKAELVPESLMDVVVSVSGSSPAYVFMFIEAMADAAVADGMPRAQAYRFAAQSVLGSAKMVLDTGMHPGVLKDMVCSPGGTTIEAVRVLEEKGMRSAVIEAMKACTEKAR